MTDKGVTAIDGGNGEVSPGPAIMSFGLGTVLAPYTMFAGAAVPMQTQIDSVDAHNDATVMTARRGMADRELGGLTVMQGSSTSRPRLD